MNGYSGAIDHKYEFGVTLSHQGYRGQVDSTSPKSLHNFFSIFHLLLHKIMESKSIKETLRI